VGFRRWGLALVAALLVPQGAARGADDVATGQPIVVVTAEAPLDEQRLADALRAYLDEFHVEVRTAPAAPTSDLRAELAATARIGAAVRAWAVVRIANGEPGSAEIELVDRVTDKSLVTSLPRPRRDEDLYRAVALKVQALMRATLAEPDAPVAASPALVRLAQGGEAGLSYRPPSPAPPAEGSSRAWAEHSLVLETGLAFVGFSSTGATQQGLAVSATGRLGRRFEVALGTQALSGIRAQSGSVSAVVDRLPLSLAGRVVARGQRWEASVGPLAELAFVSIETSSPNLTVRSGRSVVPAVGGQAGGRLHLAGSTSLYLRAAALGVIAGQDYAAQGQPLLSLAGLQFGAEAGLAVGLW
jgi:hypothetical protein